MIIISKRIKDLRLENNLTQSRLGELVGVTKVSICCYENGTRLPSLDTLVELAKVFNVSVDYLLGNDTYQIAEDNVEYSISMSKEEIVFIKELRKYGDIYYRMINDPKRFTQLIYKKLK